MHPTTFPEQNKVYRKPVGWTDEQCGDLPVWEGMTPIDNNGAVAPAIISFWKFTSEDLEEIQRTGGIYLQICSHQMVPACLYTENPFSPLPSTNTV